jgi:spore coat polysaccharide biosynthesis protein SpsF (cytidylyltransferase family)
MSNGFAFILQARSGSKRLPNKILLPFYNEKTILDIQLENLQKNFPGALIILATTTNKADDVIAEKYAGNKSINIYRGEEENVLKRFIDAAKAFRVESIVRICSDNPFLSMKFCVELIDAYFKVWPDYTSFCFNNGTPSIKSHCGLFAEMVSLKTLEAVLNSTTEPLYYEHVTNYIYSHPDSFKINFLPVPPFIDSYLDKLRLTIDTESDFTNLQKLYLAVLKKYGEKYTVEQLLTEVDRDKELVRIMTEQIRNHAK